MISSGIYIIWCIETNKVYIGSAHSIKNRFAVHYLKLTTNSHINKKLQNAWNKYGEQSFIFDIIEYVEDKSKLIEREQYYLDTWLHASEDNDLFNEICFNICKVAGNTSGRKVSVWFRKRMSEIHKGKKLHGKHKINFINSQKGKKQSNEIIAKIHKPQICIWCNNEFSPSNLHQYHNDHCLQNPNINLEKEILRRKERGKFASLLFKNKKLSKNHANKISEALKGIKHKKTKCIYCNKIATISNIVRWHNDNCKFKKLKNAA